jgi:hypothetical protein
MIVRVMAKTSGDSTRGVSGYIFCGIQDSFTTQDSRTAHESGLCHRILDSHPCMHDRPAELKPTPFPCVRVV